MFVPCAARCETDKTSNGNRKLVVLLGARADESTSTLVIEVMRGQLVDLEVTPRTVWIDNIGKDLGAQLRLAKDLSREDNTLAVIWFQLNPVDTSLLYFLLPQSDRLLVRGFDASSLGSLSEAMSVVVRGSVAFLLASGDAGEMELAETEFGRSAAPPSRSAQAPVAPEPLRASTGGPPLQPGPMAKDAKAGRRRLALGFSAAYQAELFTARIWSHGIHLGVDYRLWRFLFVSLGYDLVLTDAVYVTNLLRLSLQRHPLWLGVKGELELGQRWTLNAQLAGVLDFVVHKLDASSGAASLAADDLSVDSWLCLDLEAVVRIIDELAVTFGAGLQGGLKRSSYEASTELGRQELLVPLPIRPYGRIGIRLNLW
ncbi:MAG: hypothetical protein MUC50_15915 [Myxococcota bacterium]|nr:hypothetical protein [Myxococcota bacterium]